MFLSELIGKEVLTKKGKTLGYTRAVCFSKNFKKITAVVCSDEEEENFYLSPDCYVPARNAFVCARKSTRKNGWFPYSPIRKPVYSSQGKLLGAAEDVWLENGAPVALYVRGERYATENVKAFGDCILLDTMPETNGKNLPLGKQLKADVAAADGSKLFVAGTVVTQSVARRALRQKRLLELTVKSL